MRSRDTVREQLEVRLDGIAHGGEALGRDRGRVIFVPFAIPGEHVRVELLEEKPRWARAIFSQLAVASRIKSNARNMPPPKLAAGVGPDNQKKTGWPLLVAPKPGFATLGLIPGSATPSENVDRYTLLNLRGGYRFWNQRAEVAISAYNALNDRHREHPLGDTIGSRVMGWLTLTL